MHSCPRILVARLLAPALQLIAMVAHAPHVKKPPHIQKDFWNSFGDLCQRWRPQLVFVDANARVGSIASSVVGAAGFAQKQDATGDILHERALEASLAL
eukprot:6859455-Pyramimonas_sp.AAC.1